MERVAAERLDAIFARSPRRAASARLSVFSTWRKSSYSMKKRRVSAAWRLPPHWCVFDV
jgi:hypothetical protein